MSTPEGRPQLRIVKGDPTAEEIAALVAVLQAATSAGGEPPRRKPLSEWAAPHRRLRTAFPSGRSGWRASALPR
ncbi:MAG TPA: acyl-CoA carboxylase subunit epsilon [Nocardioidaceae bacterium]|nr:acyl-CoA carboxylase subunit epsilon [Nocardioidaceae bacterium]